MLASLVWIGAAVTLAGLATIVWCILRILKVRRASGGDDALRAALERLVPINLAAFFLSVIGLLLVVVGLVFG